MPTIAPPEETAIPSYGHQFSVDYDFFVIDDLVYDGYTNTLNVFGSTLVTGSEFRFSPTVVGDAGFTSREILQERMGATLEKLSLQGKNCIYIAGSSTDLWEDLEDAFVESITPQNTVVYGAYSYDLTAPVFGFATDDARSASGTPSAFGTDGQIILLKCDYDGSEISTYDAKFGAVDISASADTILANYINGIAQDVTTSEIMPWYNNKTVPVRNLLIPASNMPATISRGSVVASLTGSSDSILVTMGGSTSPSSGGGGGY